MAAFSFYKAWRYSILVISENDFWCIWEQFLDLSGNIW